MSITTVIAIYFLIWWLVLFAVLPWGVRPQGQAGDIAPGTDPGAPVFHALGKKLIWTTIVSTVVFAGCYLIYASKIVSFDDLAGFFRFPR